MPTWQPGPTGGLVAQTPFCYMIIFRQEGRKERYSSYIEGQNRGRLAANHDLPSEDVAKIWCVEKYRALLLAELATLDA